MLQVYLHRKSDENGGRSIIMLTEIFNQWLENDSHVACRIDCFDGEKIIHLSANH